MKRFLSIVLGLLLIAGTAGAHRHYRYGYYRYHRYYGRPTVVTPARPYWPHDNGWHRGWYNHGYDNHYGGRGWHGRR